MCGCDIPQGTWIVKGTEHGIANSGVMCVSHTALVDDIANVKRSMWLEVPDVSMGTSGGVEVTDALIQRFVKQAEQGYDIDRMTLSDPMSEDEAMAHARRGKWITCITPGKRRYRLYVVAL